MQVELFDVDKSIVAASLQEVVLWNMVDPNAADGVALHPLEANQLAFTVENTATAGGDDLEKFQVEFKPHHESDWVVYATDAELDGGDALTAVVTFKDGDAIVDLAATETSTRVIHLPLAAAVRITAEAKAGKTVPITVRGIIGRWSI